MDAWLSRLCGRLAARDGAGAAAALRAPDLRTKSSSSSSGASAAAAAAGGAGSDDAALVAELARAPGEAAGARGAAAAASAGLSDAWGACVRGHAAAWAHAASADDGGGGGDPVASFNALAGGFGTGLARAFGADAEARWMVPVLAAAGRELRMRALRADAALALAGEPETRCEECVRLLQTVVRALSVDRAPLEHTKKWAALDVANNLCQVYFALRTPLRCRDVIKVVQVGRGYPAIEDFPPAEGILYHFYVGRLRLLEENFSDAFEAFGMAFAACPDSARHNKARILTYLAAAALATGRSPPAKILERFGVTERIGPIAEAVRLGDLRGYREAFDAQRDFYLRSGVFLALEKARTFALRNLFRRCWALMGKSTVHRISTFTAIFQWLGEDDVDEEEVECILAGLIFERRIKGYISHEHGAIVLSPKDPFP